MTNEEQIAKNNRIIHERNKRDFILWISKSQVLIDCAKSIVVGIQENLKKINTHDGALDSLTYSLNYIPTMERYSVYAMLWGLAFEDLFKGGYIRANGKWNDDIQIHGLVELAKLLNLKLNSEEAEILSLLTKFVIWDGKYPIPISHKNYSIDGLPQWKVGINKILKPKFIENMESLYARFLKDISNQETYVGKELNAGRIPYPEDEKI